MDEVDMHNPAGRMRNRHFLKRKSTEKTNTPSAGKHMLLSHRAVAIKDRDSQPSPPKILSHKRKFHSIGIVTDNHPVPSNQRQKQLQQQKQSLLLQLKLKKTQMIQLNLKYLSLKQKFDTVSHSKFGSQLQFGDISNIEEHNNSISRQRRSQELTAIKERLAKFSLARNGQRKSQGEILPSDL